MAFASFGLDQGMARANPRPLPFTYQSETLPKGAVEVEQFVDLVPVRIVDTSGQPTWYLASQYQTEFEVGLTDRLELSLYVTYVPQPSPGVTNSVPALTEGNGVKQRLRYRLADPDAWPVDVALYGEVTENDREIELEGKIILQRRVGRVRFITNLWAEHELYFNGDREWVLNPTVGVTAELTPRYHLGLEGWMRAEDKVAGTIVPGVQSRGWVVKPHVFVGPAFMMNFGRMWWSNGVYLQVTNLDHTQTTTDAYGHLWVRTVVGLSF
ncbi:MAG TPA: hypothetical protein VK989_04840 [Polyangia bacterium]|nr:hypothetical protein [Polyangia bacterium]